MIFFYNLGIVLLSVLYRLAAFFNGKARAFYSGRKQQFREINEKFPLVQNEKLVWMHCASLGEFEQGRPVLESLRSMDPSLKILLTFFSPSGFEVRKKYEHADFIYYLPWDTRRNAKWLIEKMNPSLVIFVKYEFWYHYAHEISKRKIPLISISSIFRPEQVFFKSYGGLFRSILKCFNHYFVQNNTSSQLLQSIGITNVTLTGDTRFDRVRQLANQKTEFPLIQQFKNGKKLMVVGSAWPEDMQVLYPFINENRLTLKFIIAPHEISESFIREIETSIEGKSVRYSKAQDTSLNEISTLIIDNVGILSQLYRYGEFAFVGGGFQQGLHNILEPACFGIPVFFGNKAHQNFQEAIDLVLRGGAFEIGGYPDLKKNYDKLSDPGPYAIASEIAKEYINESAGATDKIVGYCKTMLS